MLHGPQLIERFLALDSFLRQHQGLWRPRPFNHLTLAWESTHPQLAAWLRGRSLADAEAGDFSGAPSVFCELASHALRLSELGALPVTALPAPPSRLNVDVPGRKWQQIEAFGSALSFTRPVEHWLDWCAGKGHLGRRLLQPNQTLTCLEYDPTLVDAGQQLSQHHRLHNANHRLQDVMAQAAALALQPHHTPVALHACGDLHVRLLQLASHTGCQQLAIAPCCYNRIAGHQYAALSSTAQASSLLLSRDDLGLPLSETVTAGARVRRQRDHSMARRLAFDLLQRQLRGMDDYLPTPSLPSAWLEKPFAGYCRDLAALKGLTVGAQDWAALEARGWERLAQVRNLESLRNLFRRPLELWLVLDRALYLQERQYNVHLGLFCPSQLTPRNLMIVAQRAIE
ncbi:MAG: methyltransferase [Pseudomonas sp.]|nr:methyltransferase [Pseudomonas sp.]